MVVTVISDFQMRCISRDHGLDVVNLVVADLNVIYIGNLGSWVHRLKVVHLGDNDIGLHFLVDVLMVRGLGVVDG